MERENDNLYKNGMKICKVRGYDHQKEKKIL